MNRYEVMFESTNALGKNTITVKCDTFEVDEDMVAFYDNKQNIVCCIMLDALIYILQVNDK